MIRVCRDCGRYSDETRMASPAAAQRLETVPVVAIDVETTGGSGDGDPAPNLCPECYARRLERITTHLGAVADTLDSFDDLLAWIEHQLIEVAGELPDYARSHAARVFGASLLLAWADKRRN